MLAILHLLTTLVADLFKSRRRLEVENLFLRHQLNVALKRAPRRLRLRGSDRILLVWMTRLCPSLLGLAQIVQPDTILRWHRAGFWAYWRWKSQGRQGKQIPAGSINSSDGSACSVPTSEVPNALFNRVVGPPAGSIRYEHRACIQRSECCEPFPVALREGRRRRAFRTHELDAHLATFAGKLVEQLRGNVIGMAIDRQEDPSVGDGS